MRRLLLFAMLWLAASAQAAWIPQFETSWVTVKAGDTRTVDVHTRWTGITDYGFVPMVFAAEDPSVATVEARWPRRPGPRP